MACFLAVALSWVTAHAAPVVKALDNGMTVVASPEPGSGRVAAVLMVRAGDADDAPGEAGAVRMLARVLMDPLNHRAPARFGAADPPGSSWTDPEADVTTFSITTTPPRAALAIRRLGLIVEPATWNSTLTMRAMQREGEAEREVVPDDWQQDFDAWQARAGLSVPPPADVNPPGREALRAAYERLYTPDRFVLAVSGDVTPEVVFSTAEDAFSMPGSRSARFVRPVPRRPRVDDSVPRPITGHYAFAGFTAPPATDPDAPAVEVIAAAIGRGKTSRLFRQLREGEGTGYESGVVYPRRLTESGVALFARAPGKAPAMRDDLAALWRDLAAGKGTDVDWDSARARAIHAYLNQHQTARDRAYWLAFWETAGKGAAFDAGYTDAIRAVSRAAILSVLQRDFSASPVGIP